MISVLNTTGAVYHRLNASSYFAACPHDENVATTTDSVTIKFFILPLLFTYSSQLLAIVP